MAPSHIAVATDAATMAHHTTGATCFERDLLRTPAVRGIAAELLIQVDAFRYRNTPRTLPQSDALAFSRDGDGGVALTGSDAGLSIRPASSLA